MLAALRSELRKLFTVRSTYFIIGACLALELLFAFYGSGIKANSANLHDRLYLASQVTQAIQALATLVAIIGVLLVTHEYRYNTITYSLTLSKSRLRVLLAKLVVISCLSAALALLLGFLSPALALLGMHFKHFHLVHQFFPAWHLALRVAFGGWGFAMLALIIAFVVRSQVGAIVTLFLVPGTLEQLAGLYLKHNQVYLPFSSVHAALDDKPAISHLHAAFVGLAYIVVGWLVAAYLFVRRDAN